MTNLRLLENFFNTLVLANERDSFGWTYTYSVVCAVYYACAERIKYM